MRPKILPILGIFFLLGMAVAVSADEKATPIPPFSEIRQTVLSYFQSQSDYQPGDLITREEVEPLLKRIVKLGLPLPDTQRILAKVLPEDSFLARQFRTPRGRQFMREIKGYPDGYDRVDRLSRLPRGRVIARDLIQGPGGARMIQYMTTAPGGKNMGNMLSRDPDGAHFNSPTGRIYTADMLLTRLKPIHAAAAKAAQKRSP